MQGFWSAHFLVLEMCNDDKGVQFFSAFLKQKVIFFNDPMDFILIDSMIARLPVNILKTKHAFISWYHILTNKFYQVGDGLTEIVTSGPLTSPIPLFLPLSTEQLVSDHWVDLENVHFHWKLLVYYFI